MSPAIGCAAVTRVFSGIQPTGTIHLGNLLGAIRFWAEDQHTHDALYCLVDLHALTMRQDPATLRAETLRAATTLVAAGLDPAVCTLFVQSHVRAHAELCWLMECTVTFGELSRMTQFKSKSEGRESVSGALFTYPALQAADIVLYDADRVPVGDDQRQHVELARDLAIRFNHHYGTTFVVPAAAIPPVGARVMDLQEPLQKMSKSHSSPMGKIDVTDDAATVAKKVRRAVTDTDPAVVYDRDAKPGVANLLDLLAATTGGNPKDLAESYTQYGPLKNDVADAINSLLDPIRARYAELSSDPAEITRFLTRGADKASDIADATLTRARDAIGLLPR